MLGCRWYPVAILILNGFNAVTGFIRIDHFSVLSFFLGHLKFASLFCGC